MYEWHLCLGSKTILQMTRTEAKEMAKATRTSRTKGIVCKLIPLSFQNRGKVIEVMLGQTPAEARKKKKKV